VKFPPTASSVRIAPDGTSQRRVPRWSPVATVFPSGVTWTDV
jgi:hypothetical protein